MKLRNRRDDYLEIDDTCVTLVTGRFSQRHKVSEISGVGYKECEDSRGNPLCDLFIYFRHTNICFRTHEVDKCKTFVTNFLSS